MANRYINRFKSFENSLLNLQTVKNRDIEDDFVISGTVQKFNLTFDIAWKVMKDVITEYYKVIDFATGSPRETLRVAASVKLIDDDRWMNMLDHRNALAHDYDGEMAKVVVKTIIEEYIPLLDRFKETVKGLNQLSDTK